MSFGFGRVGARVRIADVCGNHWRARCDDGVVQGTTKPGGEVVMVFPNGKVQTGCVPWPWADDDATEGCLVALLRGPVQEPIPWTPLAPEGVAVADQVVVSQVPVGGRPVWRVSATARAGAGVAAVVLGEHVKLGRASILAAEALGRWPGRDR